LGGEGELFNLNETSAILLAATLAAFLGFLTILSQRNIARRKATLDHLSDLEADKDIIAARNLFVELTKKPEITLSLIDYLVRNNVSKNVGLKNPLPGEKNIVPVNLQAQALRTILNINEMMAIGIQLGIIDYKFFRRYQKGQFISDWELVAPFVYALRRITKRDALYHEFEQVVGWMKDDKMPIRNRWSGLFF